jgi:hypothetical protein
MTFLHGQLLAYNPYYKYSSVRLYKYLNVRKRIWSRLNVFVNYRTQVLWTWSPVSSLS